MPVSLTPGRRLPRATQHFDPFKIAAIYENPATGWREGVPKKAWLWLVLFGGLYLAVRGLWRQAILIIAIFLGTAMIFAPLLILVCPAVWIWSAKRTQTIFRDHYMRQGWVEIDPWEQGDELA